MGCNISRREVRRRVWHITPGFLPVVLWFVPHKDPLGWSGWLILLAMTVLFGVHGFVRYRRIARPGDRERLWSVVGYAGSVLLCLLLFPGDVEIGLSVLAIIAFGDGSATVGGLTQRGPALPWNRQKTWSGFFCFLAAGVPMASLVHWGETAFNTRSVPETLPFSISLACAAAACLLAAIAESLPSTINDNVRVGLTAAIAVSLLHGLLVGWHH
jgi:phytol kinase